MTQAQTVLRPIDRMKKVISMESVQEQFKNALKENSGAFIASVIDLYGSDGYLQKCDPNKVIMECLKAATLKLPINKQLGFAFVVPYKDVPQFQIGYKGYVQLAMRTGQYKFLNAGIVYTGMFVTRNILTGETAIAGEAASEKAIGYFTYMELLNGFTKTLYMTKEEVETHAKRYSAAWKKESSPWHTQFDAMALKTTTRLLLSKYGILSTDMISALANDADQEIDEEIAENANQGEVIDIKCQPVVDEETGEVKSEAPLEQPDREPGEDGEAEQPAAKGTAQQAVFAGPGF
jgi:recombination protein RecT